MMSKSKLVHPQSQRNKQEKKKEFTKFNAKVPKIFLIHNFFHKKYTTAKIDFICGVAEIDSPGKLVEYNQLCLALELDYWWKLLKKNFFDRNEVDFDLECCKGIVYSWYFRAMGQV